MLAHEFMTPDPLFLTPSESVTTAAAFMRHHDIGMVPIVDGPRTRRLVGVITDRDLVVRCIADHHGPGCEIRDHMTREPLDTVLPTDALEQVIGKMERDQVRRIPVVDAERRLLGVISQADLATRLGPMQPLKVEELLQEISEPAMPSR